jgi:hypothetical protein
VVPPVADETELLVRQLVVRPEDLARRVVLLVDDCLLQRDDVRPQPRQLRPDDGAARGPVGVLREEVQGEHPQARPVDVHPQVWPSRPAG